ncbi:lipopolysaccharide biosynthesis protein [Gordonia sp. ABKF26]|uniref:lipopolysaccharide biosynthesis protein n=1 Tax=Gordonia sp. ABKF26 TaxID=3238687 RepID=UPI0034E442E5
MTTVNRRSSSSGSRSLTDDSISIVLTYFVTATSGMIFWVVAARVIPPHDLGVQTALISLVTAIGTVTAYGSGSAFKAMLSAPGCRRTTRLIDGLGLTTAGACILGGAGGFIASDLIGGRLASALLVSSGSIAMALFVLKDAALVGLHGTRWLPAVNVMAVALKVAIVCALANAVALSALWATVVPAAVSAAVVFLVVVPGILRRCTVREKPRAADNRLDRRSLGVFAVRDGVASTTSFGLILVLPFLSTWVAGPIPGATVALALAVAQVLDFVPDGVGSALTAHMARDPGALVGHLRRIWSVSQLLVFGGAIALGLASPVVGKIFGSAYSTREFITCLCLLSLGAVLRVPYSIWMSVLRAAMDTKTILRWNVTVFAISFPLTLFLIHEWGSIGACMGLVVSSLQLSGVAVWDLSRRFGVVPALRLWPRCRRSP